MHEAVSPTARVVSTTADDPEDDSGFGPNAEEEDALLYEFLRQQEEGEREEEKVVAEADSTVQEFHVLDEVQPMS